VKHAFVTEKFTSQNLSFQWQWIWNYHHLRHNTIQCAKNFPVFWKNTQSLTSGEQREKWESLGSRKMFVTFYDTSKRLIPQDHYVHYNVPFSQILYFNGHRRLLKRYSLLNHWYLISDKPIKQCNVQNTEHQVQPMAIQWPLLSSPHLILYASI
jgi:hypothetical protein